MEKLPEPPKHFGIKPVLQMLRTGTLLWRIYFRGGRHPVRWSQFRNFGPTSSRFDHHTQPRRAQQRSILYASYGEDAILTALAEVFQEKRSIDRTADSPWLAAFELTDPLALLDTNSKWMLRAGGNMAIQSGLRHRARQWSRKIYSEYHELHGIAYSSSLTNLQCVALYERATDCIPARALLNKPLADPTLFANLTQWAGQLGFTLR